MLRGDSCFLLTQDLCPDRHGTLHNQECYQKVWPDIPHIISLSAALSFFLSLSWRTCLSPISAWLVLWVAYFWGLLRQITGNEWCNLEFTCFIVSGVFKAVNVIIVKISECVFIKRYDMRNFPGIRLTHFTNYCIISERSKTTIKCFGTCSFFNHWKGWRCVTSFSVLRKSEKHHHCFSDTNQDKCNFSGPKWNPSG